MRALVAEPAFLTLNGRNIVDVFVSRGVQIYNVTCGNGTWDSVSDHSLVSGDLQCNADPPTQNKRI